MLWEVADAACQGRFLHSAHAAAALGRLFWYFVRLETDAGIGGMG